MTLGTMYKARKNSPEMVLLYLEALFCFVFFPHWEFLEEKDFLYPKQTCTAFKVLVPSPLANRW